MSTTKLRLGEILIKNGFINQTQLANALEAQHKTQGKVGEILIDLGYITEDDMLQCLSERLKIPYVDILNYPISETETQLVAKAFAEKNHILPVGMKNGALEVVTNEPLNMLLFDEISATTGYEVTLLLAKKIDIQTVIDRSYGFQDVTTAVDDINRIYTDEEDEELIRIGEWVEGTPIVKLVNTIIYQAYAKGASDIHFSPYEKSLEIKIRVNGDLLNYSTMNISAYNSILTRIKLLGGINIAEKRIPQDGKFRFSSNGVETDIRLSTLPTIFGEKAVLRLLDTNQNRQLLRLDALGMSENELDIYKDMIESPNGVILVSGPTGSGKTTTLYATLNQLSQKKVNIVTIEDPVEKRIANITQSQVNTAAGHTFATALRSILRQDPDIIMVGEMRDGETASIGIRAAITGHLVFSTLHTNDALSSIVRLVDMGVPSYLAAAAITGVIAQRLVKVLCPNCKKEHSLTDKERLVFGNENFGAIYEAVGCPQCNFTGYVSRAPVYEVIKADETLREMITKNVSVADMRKYTGGIGCSSLRDNAFNMAKAGITDISELKKIVFFEE